jgi:hypothetical protein
VSEELRRLPRAQRRAPLDAAAGAGHPLGR